MDKKSEDMWDYIIANGGIGCKVKTRYGIGKVVYVDAGAGIWVEPFTKKEFEDWAQWVFDITELEIPIK